MKKIFIALIAFVGLLTGSFATAQTIGDVDTQNTTGGCVSIPTDLRYRSRDATTDGQISVLQDFLQAQGILNSEPTGYFGLLTFQAVKSFQQRNGLSPTGFVGPLTRGKIKAATCGDVGTIQAPVGTPMPIACAQDAKLCPDGSYVFRAGPRCGFAQCPIQTFPTPQPVLPAPTPTPSFWVDIQANGGKNGPITIPYGTAEMLIWTSRGASYCYLTPGNNTDMEKGLSGNGAFNTSNLFTDTTYTITCANSAGVTISDSILIKISHPTVNLKVNDSEGPITIPSGTAVTLTWASTGATNCSLKPGRYENGMTETNLPIISTANTSNIFVDTTYTIGCTGYAGDVVSDSATVMVDRIPQAARISITAPQQNTMVTPGISTMIRWTVDENQFDKYQIVVGNYVTNTERPLYDRVSSVDTIPSYQKYFPWNVPSTLLDDFRNGYYSYDQIKDKFYLQIKGIKNGTQIAVSNQAAFSVFYGNNY
ncbi:MAG: Glucan endo,3-beta-glucanase, putative, glu81A [Candidatus Parcubacteria bacterium]|jgi:peptidoglycan hydrolase-like protein with peptidoglycan-binding domain